MKTLKQILQEKRDYYEKEITDPDEIIDALYSKQEQALQRLADTIARDLCKICAYDRELYWENYNQVYRQAYKALKTRHAKKAINYLIKNNLV